MSDLTKDISRVTDPHISSVMNTDLRGGGPFDLVALGGWLRIYRASEEPIFIQTFPPHTEGMNIDSSDDEDRGKERQWTVVSFPGGMCKRCKRRIHAFGLLFAC